LTGFFTARNVPSGIVKGWAMPSYSYHCEKCGKRFVQVASITDHEHRKPACPKCGSKRVLQVFAGFFAKTSRKS
jgi:putative FmdB family regulatory protein